MSEPSSLRGAEQPVVSEVSPEREWLTYAEAGRMVGLSRVTLWKLVKLVSADEVEAARIGRAVRINRESLTDYMKRSTKNPAASGI